MAKKTASKPAKAARAAKRSYVKQTDVPATSLDDALRIPKAIFENYGGVSATPLQVAKALNVDPGGRQLKLLSGAAIAFGLIEGGAQSASITTTDLSKRILKPKEDGEELKAKREAILKPRVFAEFLQKYDRHPFPRSDLGQNVLEDMGVPRDKVEEVLGQIDASARSVGFIEEIKDKLYVTLQGITPAAVPDSPDPDRDTEEDTGEPDPAPKPADVPKPVPPPTVQPKPAEMTAAIADDARRKRVFITHGQNKDLVDPIKKLLEYGELDPVVSVERTTVSKPVPEKVLDDMRSCGAAIIHVDAEKTIIEKGTDVEHVILNPNVLIEIGAAMAFYGRRFILLVRDGVKLPSNLQGLFEVRYKGATLDAESTIKLLEAIKDIKNHTLPAKTASPLA
ncbi:MAG TPA: TIR domain-containing protein [Steroidobacteraceae bacterium]|nr:TIR domain-containing protein [Steroidobacteraceae bacterium]